MTNLTKSQQTTLAKLKAGRVNIQKAKIHMNAARGLANAGLAKLTCELDHAGYCVYYLEVA